MPKQRKPVDAPAPDPSERTKTLIARRELKMARSAHAYVRGSTERFYEWIALDAGRSVPSGPAVWICGDCHVGNLGPIGRPVGAAVVELRDLDQAVIGNPAHDVVRLALSLAMSARSSDLPGVITSRMTEDLVAGYEQAFEGEAPSEKIDELPAPFRLVMKRAVRRTWNRLFEERLGSKQPRIPFGSRFWPLTGTEKSAIEALVSTEAVRKLVLMLEHRPDDATVTFMDAAFWVKGCSSLGLWRAAVLVRIEDGEKKKRQATPCLLDIKQAVEASAPWAKGQQQDLDPGERVLLGARALAPSLGTRMVAANMLDRSVFVRELLPQDLKVELDQISGDDARSVAFYLGQVVGRAHGRQLDPGARQAWQREMASRRSKSIDAPSWLWTSLTELVGKHEAAYLEHCRRYALPVEREKEGLPAAAPEAEPVRIKAGHTAMAASAAGAADADQSDARADVPEILTQPADL
ncbi:DUF2252 domain-containing protein [soil metagenome]